MTQTATEPAAPERRTRRRALKVVLASVAVLLVLVVGGAFAFALYLQHLFNSNVHHAPLLPPDGPARVAEAGDAQNILLIGSDSRTPDLAGRSDVIQLVHISRDNSDVSIIHFPRDLYVAIPGHGKSKINASYAWGGSQLLVRTLQNLLGVRIDHVVQIGFEGFAKVTDDVGGVDVYVRQAMTLPSTGPLDVGTHHLDGTQALAFVRERHQLAQGDIDRGRDQQAWLKAVAVQALRAQVLYDPVKLASLVADVARSMTVDESFTSGYIRGLALRLRGLRSSDLHFYTAPYSGFATNPTAGDIDVVDVPKMNALGRALRLDRMADYTDGENRMP